MATLTAKELKRVAAYRKPRDYTGKGIVIVYMGEVGGWMNELRDPQKWCPGCVAIDTEGNQWRATGGDDYNGAKIWEQIK